MSADDDRDTLARFDSRTTALEVQGEILSIRHPADAESLIDAGAFARDERLPYWADVWPSSLALARRVAALDGRHRRLVELGCGVGLVAAAALRAGFDVTATDYYEEALAFARANGRANAGRAPETRLVDWRDPPAALGPFDLVVAADVLYERPHGPLVARLIGRVLGPAGTALVADPGRVGSSPFLDALAEAGLRRRGASVVTVAMAGREHAITIHEIVH
ncbi:methyltransferase domain-containing protein [Candidatus Uhrbacteria bacterium]|nr:MAG: methyltransferase domain-containing protein [Candidatus Uhrbacteria bacterium]